MGSYSRVALGSRSLAATIDLITRGNFDETKKALQKARKDLHDGYEKALNSQSFAMRKHRDVRTFPQPHGDADARMASHLEAGIHAAQGAHLLAPDTVIDHG